LRTTGRIERKNGDTEKELTIAKELNRQLEDKVDTFQAESREHGEQKQRWLDGFDNMEASAKSMLTGAKNVLKA
jgi:phage-related minor tail protein